ncbi:uncharacterized protein [Aegilops tauschii subsp. strangulata]|uniref:uncharacterized protein isoform X2 n=1 Tax=Aegilops tauschii subsp. strangulata TaxID=200361 RepID=UPI00373B7C0C
MTIADHFVVDLVTDGHDMPGQLQEVDSSCPELENGMPVWFILPGTIGTWHQSTLAEFRCVGYGSFCSGRSEASIDDYNACVVDHAAASTHTSTATVLHRN